MPGWEKGQETLGILDHLGMVLRDFSLIFFTSKPLRVGRQLRKKTWLNIGNFSAIVWIFRLEFLQKPLTDGSSYSASLCSVLGESKDPREIPKWQKDEESWEFLALMTRHLQSERNSRRENPSLDGFPPGNSLNPLSHVAKIHNHIP